MIQRHRLEVPGHVLEWDGNGGLTLRGHRDPIVAGSNKIGASPAKDCAQEAILGVRSAAALHVAQHRHSGFEPGGPLECLGQLEGVAAMGGQHRVTVGFRGALGLGALCTLDQRFCRRQIRGILMVQCALGNGNNGELVAGGGPVALRKVRTLLSGGATVRLAAPEVVPEIADMAAEGRIAWERRTVARGDFERCAFALLALPPEETKEAAALAAGTGCLLDCCADAAACEWSLAAQFRSGGFTVGVASGGASPSGAAALKERLRSFLEDKPADGNARS